MARKIGKIKNEKTFEGEKFKYSIASDKAGRANKETFCVNKCTKKNPNGISFLLSDK